MYKIGDIFGIDEEYSKRAEFCNNNGLMIVEIEPANGERQFTIKEVPPPTEIEIAWQQIYEKKALLEKYKEDVEQVELFGMERADYEEKKRLCAEIIIELRELEKVVQNG